MNNTNNYNEWENYKPLAQEEFTKDIIEKKSYYQKFIQYTGCNKISLVLFTISTIILFIIIIVIVIDKSQQK